MTAEMTSQAVIKVSAKMSTKMHNSLDTVRGGLGFFFFYSCEEREEGDGYKRENTDIVHARGIKTVWMKVGGAREDDKATWSWECLIIQHFIGIQMLEHLKEGHRHIHIHTGTPRIRTTLRVIASNYLKKKKNMLLKLKSPPEIERLVVFNMSPPPAAPNQWGYIVFLAC